MDNKLSTLLCFKYSLEFCVFIICKHLLAKMEHIYTYTSTHIDVLSHQNSLWGIPHYHVKCFFKCRTTNNISDGTQFLLQAKDIPQFLIHDSQETGIAFGLHVACTHRACISLIQFVRNECYSFWPLLCTQPEHLCTKQKSN